MQTYLLSTLQCPACHGVLDWHIVEKVGERIETAEARCDECSSAYSVRDGIGIFLTPDLPRNDLWELVDHSIAEHIRQHPEIEQQLMDVPLATLAPADQFFRALVLESHGEYHKAQEVEDLVNERLYTAEYLDCWQSQIDAVVNALQTTEGPVVDLASGRCGLVAELVRKLQCPIVATDFSPGVLRRNRKWLESFGLYDSVSLLAFDARRTPFKDGAVGTLTTNLGLPNIEEPGTLLEELYRIVDGTFLAISHFFPEDDETNGSIIREAGLDKLLYKRTALDQFTAADWDVELLNTCTAEVRPTPPSIILEGARMDGLPIADTTIEWCILSATNS